MAKRLTKLYQFLNLLSLDVAAGAVVCALFFCKIFQVNVLIQGLACLGLTVWIIYTVDHLLDARATQYPASSRRHRFHQDHFQLIAGLVMLATVLDGTLVLFVRRPVLQSGFYLALAVALYLIVQRNLKFAKEISGAVLYCSGVMLPALSLMRGLPDRAQGILILQFCITVFCNLILFSLFDLRSDIRDRHQSFVTSIGERNTRGVLFVLFALNAILVVYQVVRHVNYPGPLTVLTSMNALLFMILIFRKRFEDRERYRLLGDAVFLVPLFFLV